MPNRISSTFGPANSTAEKIEQTCAKNTSQCGPALVNCFASSPNWTKTWLTEKGLRKGFQNLYWCVPGTFPKWERSSSSGLCTSTFGFGLNSTKRPRSASNNRARRTYYYSGGYLRQCYKMALPLENPPIFPTSSAFSTSQWRPHSPIYVSCSAYTTNSTSRHQPSFLITMWRVGIFERGTGAYIHRLLVTI